MGDPNMQLRRRTSAVGASAALALTLLASPGADAVNADHGDRVATAMPAAGTPHVMNGTVMGFAQIGNKVVVVGTFTSVSPSSTFTNKADDVTRNRIFAFDATTGAIDPNFNPNLGGAANSIDTDGTYLYVGGGFGNVGGNTAIKRLVKLDANGQVVSTFKSVPSAVVNDVVVRGSRLYVGGSFKNIKSGGVTTPRTALAAVDATTGAPLAGVNLTFSGVYDPNQNDPGVTNIKKLDVNAAGTRLVAVGNFNQVAGQSRSQVAVIDVGAANAALTSWSTNRYDRSQNFCAGVFDSFVRNVDISPDGSYFVVSSTGAFGGGSAANSMCDTISRWETGGGSGSQPSWISYTGGDTTYGVAVTGSAVYIGGHQRWHNNPFQGDQAGPGAVPRQGVAALDPVNGVPLRWNPGRARGVGAQAVYATSQGVWVGSDTTLFNNQRRGRIAFLPLAGGTQVPNVPAATLPNDFFIALQSSGTLQRRAMTASGTPSGSPSAANSSMDWSQVRGAFMLNGSVYYGLSSGGFFKRTFNPTTGALGSQQTINLYDDPDNGQRIPWSITSMTGMFYDPGTHRIYYTVSGDSRLYYRYFTPESEIVGAQTFTADAGSVNFNNAAGLTLASGRIYYGSSSDEAPAVPAGSLRSAPFSGGRVTGSSTTVSTDRTWRARAIFVPSS
jgi:hypothetical protein